MAQIITLASAAQIRSLQMEALRLLIVCGCGLALISAGQSLPL